MATERGASYIRDEVDEALGSLGRLRIVAELARDPGRMLTVYAIAVGTHLKRDDVKSNLAHLLAVDWVRKLGFTPVKYQINLGNATAARFVDFLRETGYL
jgi:hypothetical protein